MVMPEQLGNAFTPAPQRSLDLVFSLQHERTVNRDNTVAIDNRILQLEKTRWRNTLAGCSVVVCEHLNGEMSVRYGPHEVARYEALKPGDVQMKAAASAASPKRRRSPRVPGSGRKVA